MHSLPERKRLWRLPRKGVKIMAEENKKEKKEIIYTGDAKIAADNVAFCEKAVEDAKAALAQAKAELKEAYAKQRKEEREARAKKKADAKAAVASALSADSIEPEELMAFLESRKGTPVDEV